MRPVFTLWRATGFDTRFVAAVTFVIVAAPFLASLLIMLFATGPNGEPYESKNLFMVVLISGAYGVAEAILSMPYSVVYGVVGWLVVHVSLTKLKLSDPWPARFGIVAFAFGYCSARGLHWQSVNLEVSNRLWELIAGVVPATVLAVSMVYRSGRYGDTEEAAD